MPVRDPVWQAAWEGAIRRASNDWRDGLQCVVRAHAERSFRLGPWEFPMWAAQLKAWL